MKLNEAKQQRLKRLELKLRQCLRSGDSSKAEVITQDIQAIFGDDRIDPRLLKAKLWCFEAALLDNRVAYAESGLNGVRRRAGAATKLKLEAEALIVVCYLRQKRYAGAKQLVEAILRKTNTIVSERSRHLFQKRFLERLEEEIVLSALAGGGEITMDPDEMQREATSLAERHSEDEILAIVGNSLPASARLVLMDFRAHALLQVHLGDARLLGTSTEAFAAPKLGRRILKLFKRITWKTFCAPESAVFKLWNQTAPRHLGTGYMAAALITAFKDWRIGLPLLATGILAALLRTSAHEFCAWAKPEAIVATRTEVKTHQPR